MTWHLSTTRDKPVVTAAVNRMNCKSVKDRRRPSVGARAFAIVGGGDDGDGGAGQCRRMI